MSTNFSTIDSIACANPQFLEELFTQYLKNPNQIDPSWRHFFQNIDQQSISLTSKAIPSTPKSTVSIKPTQTKSAEKTLPQQYDERINKLIEGYRIYGHRNADINPIALTPSKEPMELKIETYGFTPDELNAQFYAQELFGENPTPLKDIISKLKIIYCQTIGYEYIGLDNVEREQWLQQKIESDSFQHNLTIEQKHLILKYLNKSELFELFLHTKYVGQKRFSLEGGETLIPILSFIIETGNSFGADDFVIGMAHRGRLNVLANILNKSYSNIFSEFEEGYIPNSFEGSGDVKYHKGFASTTQTSHGNQVHISITPNPSHLEAVLPVVEGQVRARQTLKKDLKREKVIPIVIHGDASISGQGVVYETMQFYRLKGYTTGGTIHIVVNNQIGFTTHPLEGRSTEYCTDIAKTFLAPVFHVNAEDPEGCIAATLLAVEMRQKFHCDVFIDLNCYRKFGHNETDEPAFTQPLEYQLIRSKKPIREIYRDKLINQGVVEKSLAESLEIEFKDALQEAMKLTKSPKAEKEKSKSQNGLLKEYHEQDIFSPIETGIALEQLKFIAEKTCTIPKGFNLHPKLKNLLKDRLEMVIGSPPSKMVDWGMAETLAYGTLLLEGVHVRISGQDCCRGTFSHRHAVWIDQAEEKSYYPLQHMKEGQQTISIFNSPLSEYAVLGFEFGYNLSYPQSLVIWEAQFGDFCNGAQIIIDQFIATTEQKWGQKSSLVLLLPHGYEGQGPEHSSARIERFLALAGNDNFFVVHPSTPAQLFHLLRRQCLSEIKKPLIVFTPKGLLRHPECVNPINDFTLGSFNEIIDDPLNPRNAERLVICSGHVYYPLSAERSKLNSQSTAIVRIEQLYPLNIKKLQQIIEKYKGVKEVIWAQEEPSNMGPWNFIEPILRSLLPKNMELKYAGRERSSSPAVGSYALHKKQHEIIINTVFSA